MLKKTSILISIFLISCGSKSKKNSNDNENSLTNNEPIINPQIVDDTDYFKLKLKKQEDIFGYWKLFNNKNNEKLNDNTFYYFDKNTLKKCSISLDADKIISNEEHSIKWINHKDFKYIKNSNEVKYSLEYYQYLDINKMYFSVNGESIALENIDNPTKKQFLDIVKEKCNM